MLAHMALCSKDMAWGRESINGFAVKPHDLKLELREAFQKVFSMANIIKSVLVQEKNTMSSGSSFSWVCVLPSYMSLTTCLGVQRLQMIVF